MMSFKSVLVSMGFVWASAKAAGVHPLHPAPYAPAPYHPAPAPYHPPKVQTQAPNDTLPKNVM